MDTMWALIVAGQQMMTFSTNTQCIAYLQAAGLGTNPGAGCVQIVAQQTPANDPCAGMTTPRAIQNCRSVHRGVDTLTGK